MGKDLSKPETLESFREATMRMDNVYSRFSKICGLSDAEYWSLLMIYEGGATQSQISGQLFLSRQTLNSAFKQLRKKGLVRLEPYAENQRSKQAFLTDAGKEFVEKYVLQMHRLEEQEQRRPPEARFPHEVGHGLLGGQKAAAPGPDGQDRAGGQPKHRQTAQESFCSRLAHALPRAFRQPAWRHSR